MKIMNIIKSVISYLFTFFAGVYGLCLIDGEVDFFMILGFIACIVVAVITSPLSKRFFEHERKGR